MLLVFAVVTYLITGSVWTTFVDTVICAVLVQVGYFAAVLFLVWRARRSAAEAASPSVRRRNGRPKEEQPRGGGAGLRRPRQSDDRSSAAIPLTASDADRVSNAVSFATGAIIAGERIGLTPP